MAPDRSGPRFRAQDPDSGLWTALDPGFGRFIGPGPTFSSRIPPRTPDSRIRPNRGLPGDTLIIPQFGTRFLKFEPFPGSPNPKTASFSIRPTTPKHDNSQFSPCKATFWAFFRVLGALFLGPGPDSARPGPWTALRSVHRQKKKRPIARSSLRPLWSASAILGRIRSRSPTLMCSAPRWSGRCSIMGRLLADTLALRCYLHTSVRSRAPPIMGVSGGQKRVRDVLPVALTRL